MSDVTGLLVTASVIIDVSNDVCDVAGRAAEE